MLGGSTELRALAVITFPTRVGLPRYDQKDLGLALIQIGQAIVAGHKPHTGTFIVPYQERAPMKVSLDMTGPDGKDMWGFNMSYFDLPEAYAWEVAGAASAYANFIQNMKGTAGQLKAYGIKFKWESDPGTGGDKMKGNVKAEKLLYSQAVEVQKAGIALLEKLLMGADMEIASGQRS